MSIEDYDFSDEDVIANIEGDKVWLIATAYSELNRYDVIQLAKHFKLTANDLNTD